MKPIKFMSAHETIDHVMQPQTYESIDKLCKKTGYAKTYIRRILSDMNQKGYKFMIRNGIVWREK